MASHFLFSWKLTCDFNRGVYKKLGNGARCTMAKIGGGEFVMIMMLLLVSIIIYYYIHEYIYYFTPVHF